MALPGVRILPGEELYAEYGKEYWLDHLPDLPSAIRTTCIQKYKYRHSELAKAGLNPDGSRPTSAPFVTTSPQLRAWTTAALEDLINCFLPTPDPPRRIPAHFSRSQPQS